MGRENPNILFNYSLVQKHSDLVIETLESAAAEQGAEPEHELLQVAIILRKQNEMQTSRRNEIVNCTCWDCPRSVQVPNELLKGQYLETSAEFFCPFCDPTAKEPRCVICRVEHNKSHMPGAVPVAAPTS